MLTTSTPAPFHLPDSKDDGFNVFVMSADGERFCVDRQKLASASTVLRHMLSPSLAVLTLHEPASSLAPFLDVLTGTADLFPVVNARASVLGAIDVLRLFVKYDCTAQLTLAATALKCMVMEHDVCALEVFILGAAVGDVSLCRTAIVFGDNGNDIMTLDGQEHADAIQAHWKAVPSKYKIALVSAYEAKEPRDRGNRFAEAMYLEDHKAEVDHIEQILSPAPATTTATARVTGAAPAYAPPAYTATVPKINVPQPRLGKIQRPQVQRYEIDDDPFLSDDDD